MSLNWDITAIPEEVRTIVAERDGNEATGEDFKKGERIMNPVTNALIWMTMGVGMGTITADNALEFYTRCTISEKLFGASLSVAKEGSGREPRPFTYGDIIAHVGLKTNVTLEKRVSWLASVAKQMQGNAEAARRNYEREQKAKPLDDTEHLLDDLRQD